MAMIKGESSAAFQFITCCLLLLAEATETIDSALLITLMPTLPPQIFTLLPHLNHFLTDSPVTNRLKVACDSSSAFELKVSRSDSSGESICLPNKVCLLLPNDVYCSMMLLKTRLTEKAISHDLFMDSLRLLLLPLQVHLQLLDNKILDGPCASVVGLCKHLLRDDMLVSPLEEEIGWDILQCDLSVIICQWSTEYCEMNDSIMPVAVDADQISCNVKVILWLYFHVSLDLQLLDNDDHYVLHQLTQDITSVGQLSSHLYLSTFVPLYVFLWAQSLRSDSSRDPAVLRLVRIVMDIIESGSLNRCDSSVLYSHQDIAALCPLATHSLLLQVLGTLHRESLLTSGLVDFLFERVIATLSAPQRELSKCFFLDDRNLSFLLDYYQSIAFPSQVSYLNYCTTIATLGRIYTMNTSHGLNLYQVLSPATMVRIAMSALYAEDYEMVHQTHLYLRENKGLCNSFLNTCLLNSATGYSISSCGSEDVWDLLHSHLGTHENISIMCESEEVLNEVRSESLLKIHSLLRESAKLSVAKEICPRIAPFTAELSDSFQGGRVPLALADLTPLHTLTLSHNEVTTFPESILTLVNLVRLNLSWNKLSSIPKSISLSLGRLQVLDISHNAFVEFPKCILKLNTLVELYLQDNSIEEIRNDILLLEKLQHLDISNNRLKSIPPRLNQSLKLVYFRFSGNPLLYNSSIGSGSISSAVLKA